MQEEVNEKTIALCVRGGKISADILRNALIKLLRELDSSQKKIKQKIRESAEDRPEVIRQGKKSLESMMQEGSELTNIEITDKNIKSFEKVARKYSIDYSLKKDKSIDPPRYLVFFRARDTDVMTAAFKEYTGVTLQKSKKVSIVKRLHKAIERSAKHRELEKSRQKQRGQER